MRQWLDETGTAPCSRRAQASRSLTASELSSMWKVCLCQGQSTSFNPPFHLEPSTSFLRNPPRWRWVAGLPTVLAIDVPTSRAGRATHSFQNKSQVEKKIQPQKGFFFSSHIFHIFLEPPFLPPSPDARVACPSRPQLEPGSWALSPSALPFYLHVYCTLELGAQTEAPGRGCF